MIKKIFKFFAAFIVILITEIVYLVGVIVIGPLVGIVPRGNIDFIRAILPIASILFLIIGGLLIYILRDKGK